MILSEVRKEDDYYYKGAFWVIADSVPDILVGKFTIDGSKILCSYEGKLDRTRATRKNETHESVWNELSSKYGNVPYNYYPRGRVEIAHGKATVYLSPHINIADIQNWIIDKFNLNEHNGINKVRFISDYSEHYKCYLDEEMI